MVMAGETVTTVNHDPDGTTASFQVELRVTHALWRHSPSLRRGSSAAATATPAAAATAAGARRLAG